MKFLFKKNCKNSWILCCFLNFLIASAMGLLLRFTFLFPLPFINYSFLLHAHSHIAMLGWVYLMIYVLIVCMFVPEEKREKPIYNKLFWLTEFSVIGMMISFPFQGYTLFSILFSTIHILLSYVFCWLVWKDRQKNNGCSQIVLFAAIMFMLVSTFGVWCLGPAVKTLGKQSAFYQIAIQFFLHFQFNGWFLFAVLALFLRQFKEKIDKGIFIIFFSLLIISVFLTIAFPISWYVDNKVLSWINACGVLLQLVAFTFFYKMLQPQIKDFKSSLNTLAKIVYSLAVCSLFLKIVIQLVVLIPSVGESSHQIRNFVIGFIHLITLGIITGFLLGVLLQNKILNVKSSLLQTGIKCFAFGYVTTEIILFLQGLFFYCNAGLIANYYYIVFAAGIFIVAGLLLIVVSILNKKQETII